jgi:formylglycine-generating enzyme required for sulfatase activity
VIRGGAWNGSFPEWLHPAFRYAQDPKSQSHGVGFRCAKSLSAP